MLSDNRYNVYSELEETKLLFESWADEELIHIAFRRGVEYKLLNKEPKLKETGIDGIWEIAISNNEKLSNLHKLMNMAGIYGTFSNVIVENQVDANDNDIYSLQVFSDMTSDSIDKLCIVRTGMKDYEDWQDEQYLEYAQTVSMKGKGLKIHKPEDENEELKEENRPKKEEKAPGKSRKEIEKLLSKLISNHKNYWFYRVDVEILDTKYEFSNKKSTVDFIMKCEEHMTLALLDKQGNVLIDLVELPYVPKLQIA